MFSFFNSKPTPSQDHQPQETPQSQPPKTEPEPEPRTESKTESESKNSDLPKLWTPQTNKKLFLGGLAFFTLSILTTRRSLRRRFAAATPPFYTSSPYHKPKVNGAGEAFEALNLATLNVLSFAMMASGGVLYALDINGVDDMRVFVRKGMLGEEDLGRGLGEADKELEKEVEEWIGKYLGKKVEGDKLVDLERGGGK